MPGRQGAVVGRVRSGERSAASRRFERRPWGLASGAVRRRQANGSLNARGKGSRTLAARGDERVVGDGVWRAAVPGHVLEQLQRRLPAARHLARADEAAVGYDAALEALPDHVLVHLGVWGFAVSGVWGGGHASPIPLKCKRGSSPAGAARRARSVGRRCARHKGPSPATLACRRACTLPGWLPAALAATWKAHHASVSPQGR